MLDSSDEIAADIEATLDLLLENAAALREAETSTFFTHEVDALKKTQESLLARLMHRQAILDLDNKGKVLDSIRNEEIQNKVIEFAKKGSKRQNRARSRKARSKSRG